MADYQGAFVLVRTKCIILTYLLHLYYNMNQPKDN